MILQHVEKPSHTSYGRAARWYTVRPVRAGVGTITANLQPRIMESEHIICLGIVTFTRFLVRGLAVQPHRKRQWKRPLRPSCETNS